MDRRAGGTRRGDRGAERELQAMSPRQASSIRCLWSTEPDGRVSDGWFSAARDARQERDVYDEDGEESTETRTTKPRELSLTKSKHHSKT